MIRLGLRDELDKVAFRSPFFHQRRWHDGRTLTRIPLGDQIEKKFGAPHYIFHRGELHAVLAKAVPPERVHLAHRCVGVRQIGDRVEAQFDNGVTATADVLIGADGIHSAVRRALLGAEPPRFACRAYRGLIPVEQVRDIPEESDGMARPGPALRALFRLGRPDVELRRPCRAGRLDQRVLDRAGQRRRPARRLCGLASAGQRIIDAVDETFIWAVIDRQPIARWTYGRITMLGDACHPMLPFLGQGGAQAIEDAAAITACLLRRGDDVEAALKLYETVRLPRASQVQDISWGNKTRFHMPDGPDQEARDAAMADGMTDWSYRPITWLYSHDAGVIPDTVPEAAPAPH